MNTIISISGDIIHINNKSIKLDYPILDAFAVNNIVIILYDPDSNISKFGQFQNLVAIDVNGNFLWYAELPTNESGDCYYKIKSREPLIVISWKSYSCNIDITSGKITEKVFSK